MIKAVLDTNIFISSLFWKGNARRIVDLAEENKITSITSPQILHEVEVVLREDFDIPYQRIDQIIRDILSYSELIIPRAITIKELRDLKDAKIITCALSAKADYIVTGDKDLLVLRSYQGIPIITARTFLDLF